jgi:glyoxylase-like metal-dependent hydrolase (beta-lactamase superfamily II)
VKEGDALRWGDYSARVMHTPGHSPGSISLLVEKGKANAELQNHSHDHEQKGGHVHSHGSQAGPARLIAGDTLFHGGIGRTDLWGGSMKDILSSIREKLMRLPDETLVIPGHGDLTTIGEEREFNPFLK